LNFDLLNIDFFWFDFFGRFHFYLLGDCRRGKRYSRGVVITKDLLDEIPRSIGRDTRASTGRASYRSPIADARLLRAN
jgi:hypothetical protein